MDFTIVFIHKIEDRVVQWPESARPIILGLHSIPASFIHHFRWLANRPTVSALTGGLDNKMSVNQTFCKMYTFLLSSVNILMTLTVFLVQSKIFDYCSHHFDTNSQYFEGNTVERK